MAAAILTALARVVEGTTPARHPLAWTAAPPVGTPLGRAGPCDVGEAVIRGGADATASRVTACVRGASRPRPDAAVVALRLIAARGARPSLVGALGRGTTRLLHDVVSAGALRRRGGPAVQPLRVATVAGVTRCQRREVANEATPPGGVLATLGAVMSSSVKRIVAMVGAADGATAREVDAGPALGLQGVAGVRPRPRPAETRLGAPAESAARGETAGGFSRFRDSPYYFLFFSYLTRAEYRSLAKPVLPRRRLVGPAWLMVSLMLAD